MLVCLCSIKSIKLYFSWLIEYPNCNKNGSHLGVDSQHSLKWAESKNRLVCDSSLISRKTGENVNITFNNKDKIVSVTFTSNLVDLTVYYVQWFSFRSIYDHIKLWSLINTVHAARDIFLLSLTCEKCQLQKQITYYITSGFYVALHYSQY